MTLNKTYKLVNVVDKDNSVGRNPVKWLLFRILLWIF